jgi:hypothetical protein
MYRQPDNAFTQIDFTGRGYILEEELLNKFMLLRGNISYEDALVCVRTFNMFNNKDITNFSVPPNGMTQHVFKKIFFPHLCAVREDDESDGEKEHKRVKNGLITSPDLQPQIAEKRIKDLEKMLKEKFAIKFKSVREAFLTVDADHDGVITVEDMLKIFKPEDGIDYNDLKKLMQDKDSKRQGDIGYTDFSKWLGGAIHQVSGFYFRHDSNINPA